jgi:hypothetical protein
VSGTYALKKGVEFRSVVKIPEMAELVEDNIVPQFIGKVNQPQIQVNVALGGAAAPVAQVVLDENAVVFESVKVCQLPKPDRKRFFGNGSQTLHLGR